MTISVREATWSDVQEIARIGSTAFNDEPIYEHFFPYRSQFPEHYYKSFVDDAKKILSTPGQILVVAEMDEEEEEEEEDVEGDTVSQSKFVAGKEKSKLVGYASFIKTGSPEEFSLWNPDSWTKRLSRYYQWARQLVGSFLFPNKAVSPATVENYYSQAAKIHAKYLEESKTKIEFKTLAVDVNHQRQGVGQKLVEWCGYRAYAEQVQVFGDASANGLPLYLRNGCKEIGRINLPEQIVHGRKIEALEVVVLRWLAADYFS